MTFENNVEKWRNLVNAQITRLSKAFPYVQSLQDRFKLTLSDSADIILALIKKESSGNENATGDSGNSIGLMQLNFGAGTPQGLGYRGTKDELYIPEKNIYWGSLYFFSRLKHYENIDAAILSYNAGSLIYEAGTNIPINLQYLKDVLSYLEKKSSVLPDLSRLASASTIYSSGKNNKSPLVAGPDLNVISLTTADIDRRDPTGQLGSPELNILSQEKKRTARMIQSAAGWILFVLVIIGISCTKLICESSSRIF